MRFVLWYTTTDYENRRTNICKEEFTDFEDMMEVFTLLCSTRDNVMVIETENNKVVCQYLSQGKVTFNKHLIDGALYVNPQNQQQYE